MLFALVLAAEIAAPAPLPPSGPWKVHVEGNVCVARRDFGAGTDKITVTFLPVFTSPNMSVAIEAEDHGNVPPTGDAVLQLSPTGEPVKGTYRSSILNGSTRRATWVSVPATVFTNLGAGTELKITSKATSFRIALASAAKATAAFATCENQLLESWGIDSARLRPAHPPVPANSLAAFMPDTYPQDAMRLRQGGRTFALISVDSKGAVEGCRVIVKLVEQLDRATCEAGYRMRFKAASDANNHAVPSIYVLPVNWIPPS